MDPRAKLGGTLAVTCVMFWAATGGADDFLNDGLFGVSPLMGAVREIERAPSSSPDDMVAFHSDQWGVKGHVAVAAGPTHHWIEDVLEGYDGTVSANQFFVGNPIHPNSTCDVLAYDGTSPVQTVIARESGNDLGVSRRTLAILDSAAETLIENYERSGYRGGLPGSGPRVEIVDVVIPKTVDPVHLALVSTGTDVIWSLHFEQGATLAGVSMIGGNSTGILRLSNDVPVEIITRETLNDCDIKPMLQDYENYGEDAYMDVLVEPGLEPTPPSTALPTTIPELELAVAQARPDTFRLWETTFELWFSRQFGQNPRTGIAGYANVQVVVAGQPPATPVPWTPPQGAYLRLLNGPIYLVGSLQTRQDAWDNLVQQRAEAILGVPLETRHPDVRPPEDDQIASQ